MPYNWRPTTIRQFIGQRHIVEELAEEVVVCRADRVPMTNRIYYGAPGLGKTTLLQAVANELGVPAVHLVGKETDLQSLSNALAHLPAEGYAPGPMERGGGRLVDPAKARPAIVGLDEVDALPRKVLQLLHPIMEGPRADGRPHIFPGLDERGREQPFWVPNVTFWLLTNYVGDLQKADVAIFSRCAHPVEFRPYTIEELSRIITQFAEQMGWKITEGARRGGGVAARACSDDGRGHREVHKQPRYRDEVVDGRGGFGSAVKRRLRRPATARRAMPVAGARGIIRSMDRRPTHSAPPADGSTLPVHAVRRPDPPAACTTCTGRVNG